MLFMLVMIITSLKKEYCTMESVHFYQSIGTLREPSGMYLPYGGYEIIPYVYTVTGIVTHIKDEWKDDESTVR